MIMKATPPYDASNRNTPERLHEVTIAQLVVLDEVVNSLSACARQEGLFTTAQRPRAPEHPQPKGGGIGARSACEQVEVSFHEQNHDFLTGTNGIQHRLPHPQRRHDECVDDAFWSSASGRVETVTAHREGCHGNEFAIKFGELVTAVVRQQALQSVVVSVSMDNSRDILRFHARQLTAVTDEGDVRLGENAAFVIQQRVVPLPPVIVKLLLHRSCGHGIVAQRHRETS